MRLCEEEAFENSPRYTKTQYIEIVNAPAKGAGRRGLLVPSSGVFLLIFLLGSSPLEESMTRSLALNLTTLS